MKGAWVRIGRAIPISDETLRFVVDASPWGIGGLKLAAAKPLEWLRDKLTDGDARAVNAVIGKHGYTTTWELLAILVALRFWACKGSRQLPRL
eukprot:445515-Amphidinium_carterae.1